MSLLVIFKIVVVVFTVANLSALGLELNLREAFKSLYGVRAVALILICGWVVGPALAWLITKGVPLMEAHAAGLLMISLAPTAPFLPLMVARAGGDMSFTGAYMLLTTLATVVLMPLLMPLLVTGVSIDAWLLAKPLLVLVLLPLLLGSAIRLIAPNLAKTLSPVLGRIGGIFLLLCLGLTLVLYGHDMLGAVGSFAPGALLLFIVMITALSYLIGFGLPQAQRSSMALGMCTRNTAAAFAGYFGIANPPAGLFVMIILVVPLATPVAMLASRLFARQVQTN